MGVSRKVPAWKELGTATAKSRHLHAKTLAREDMQISQKRANIVEL